MKKVALALVILSQQAWANWTALTPDEFQLAAPPVPGSVEEKRDQDAVLHEEKQRTSEQCLVGNIQTVPRFTVLYGPGNGILSEAEYREVHYVMRKVFDLTARLSSIFKKRYARPRPYQTMKTISPCLFKPGYDDSYPSAHAAIGEIGACLLAKKFPDKAEALKTQGALVGDLRVIGGVHHPTDIQAGRVLAEQICERLWQFPSFRKELGIVP